MRNGKRKCSILSSALCTAGSLVACSPPRFHTRVFRLPGQEIRRTPVIASEQTREGSSLPEPPRTIASRAPRHSPSALRKCALGRGGRDLSAHVLQSACLGNGQYHVFTFGEHSPRIT